MALTRDEVNGLTAYTPGEAVISGSGGNVVTSPMTSTQGSIRTVHDLNLASYLSS